MKQIGLAALPARRAARCLLLAMYLAFDSGLEALSQPVDQFCEDELKNTLGRLTLDYLAQPRHVVGAKPPVVHDDILRALEYADYKVRFRERVNDYATGDYLIRKLRHPERCSHYVRIRLRMLLDR